MSSKGGVIISGIYTSNYSELVKLQETTCKDSYFYDYYFITDDEWNRNKNCEDFAFYGGNILKTQLVIDKIKAHFGKTLIVTDADLVFLRETREEISAMLKNYDMLFLRERGSHKELFDRAKANINIGFVAMNCNEASLDFWKQVQAETSMSKGWDQEVVNNILLNDYKQLKYTLLPETYLNGGEINADNVDAQRICTACGSISSSKGFSKVEFLEKAIYLANKGEWFN